MFESKCLIMVYTSDQITYCKFFYTLINIKLVNFEYKLLVLKPITSAF